MTDQDKFRRRIRLDLNTPAEIAIFKAMQEVERIGADSRLTEAGNLLSLAKSLVADYIDEQIYEKTKP